MLSDRVHPGDWPAAPTHSICHITQVYMENMISAGERVLATLRLELFRVLLMQKVSTRQTVT